MFARLWKCQVVYLLQTGTLFHLFISSCVVFFTSHVLYATGKTFSLWSTAVLCNRWAMDHCQSLGILMVDRTDTVNNMPDFHGIMFY